MIQTAEDFNHGFIGDYSDCTDFYIGWYGRCTVTLRNPCHPVIRKIRDSDSGGF